jgi:dihydrofolate reductase
MKISIIVAADEQNGIGKGNQLLCHLPNDLKYFKRITTGRHIVMGRNTYESIGRPLPNRVNLVLSRNPNLKIDGCLMCADINQAIDIAKHAGETELMITGGGALYAQSLHLADKVYLTRIHHTFDADTFFPQLSDDWKCTFTETHGRDEKHAYAYTFMVYEKTIQPD